MADNVTLNAGAGGAVLATDDISSVHYPIGKIAIGALNSATLLSGGAGAVDAGTVRVTLASDDPGVALLTTLAALSRAEDAAHSSGHTGVMGLSVRQDTAAALAGTDADYQPLITDANGKLHVNAGTVTVASHAVTNAGTFVVQENGAALTSLQLIDDVVIADDAAFVPATTKVLMAGFEFDDSSPDSVDEGDAGAGRMSARREQYIQIRDAAGNERGANVNASGQMAVAGPVTIDAGAVTSLALIDDVVYAEDIAAAGADKGISVLAVRRDTPTALATTDNDYIQLTTNATGHLWVAGPVTVASGGIASGGIASGAVASGAIASGAVASGAYASGALAAGSIASGAIADMLVDDAAFTPATSRVMPAGFQADETATDSVDEGDVGAGRMTLDRKQIVTLQPHTAGGLTTAMFSGSDGSSILVATSQVVKASAGQLYGYYAFNPEAAVTFVHFYNTASASVTVGTTNPLFTIAIPAGSAANLTIPQGITFSNAGWAVAATTTAAGNTAPSTGVSLVVWYM